MALRPVFPADFLPADLVVGAIFYNKIVLANGLVAGPMSIFVSQQLRCAIAEDNRASHRIQSAVHTDRGSRCGVSRR